MQFKIIFVYSFFILLIVSCSKKSNPIPRATPVISNFNIPTKYIGDATFFITPPTSSSTGAFTYTSGNPAIATIKGDSIQIMGTGSVTITASQDGVETFTSGTINTVFKVLPSVYITGYAYSGDDQPLYWRNGAATILPGNGVAKCVVTQNNDVYVGGNIQLAGGDEYAGYWKNGVQTLLQKNSVVNAMAISGQDVYVVGYIETFDASGNDVAALWKNGVVIPLTNPVSCCGLVSGSNAFAITINNNTVYIVGTSTSVNGYTAATIWKADGTATALTSPDVTAVSITVSTATGIAFQGSDMYISGSIGTADGNNFLGYWKNGAFISNQVPVHTYPNNTTVAINNNDVYNAGIYAENNVLSAAYWKNGVETILATNATANGIGFAGNDMYIAGNTLSFNNFSTYPSPVYWLNGTLVTLPTSVPNNTSTTSIFVRNQ